MTTLDEKTCEQLSAWMDGELPADEARFLERRLANDPALRARWERMQLASSCLKGHSLRPMPSTLSANIAQAIDEPVAPTRSGRPWLGWAVAASVALAAIVIVPNWTGGNDPGASNVADATPGMPADNIAVPVFVPTPSSADLVASNGDTTIDTRVSAPVLPSTPRAGTAPVVVASVPDRGNAQSPADFPLTAANGGKAWPRSPLAGDDPALEAYLIRHNQMMGDDGLSGFVPYVDVVTNDARATDAGDEGEANR